MQEMHLFEYAIIRVVPRVEREEFLNVGVILYCAHENFLQTKISIDKKKLAAFTHKIDMEELECSLNAFEEISKGNSEGGSIGKLPIASRFRWLTATRSTIVQISPVHPGLCINPQETIDRLYEELVR
jgi:hypothetical protein